jgi:hypothetical protein
MGSLLIPLREGLYARLGLGYRENYDKACAFLDGEEG